MIRIGRRDERGENGSGGTGGRTGIGFLFVPRWCVFSSCVRCFFALRRVRVCGGVCCCRRRSDGAASPSSILLLLLLFPSQQIDGGARVRLSGSGSKRQGRQSGRGRETEGGGGEGGGREDRRDGTAMERGGTMNATSGVHIYFFIFLCRCSVFFPLFPFASFSFFLAQQRVSELFRVRCSDSESLGHAVLVRVRGRRRGIARLGLDLSVVSWRGSCSGEQTCVKTPAGRGRGERCGVE